MKSPLQPIAREAYSYRADPAVGVFPDDRPVLIFDGACVLCSGFAQFILRHDKQARFRLLAAQSPLGAALYRHYGLDPIDYQTNILIEDGQAYFESESSIRAFTGLGFPWSLAAAARILPAPVRDRLYGVVARNRLKWFGRQPVCLIPDPAKADRFLA